MSAISAALLEEAASIGVWLVHMQIVYGAITSNS